jgi:translation initiation factor 3 subunit J
MLTEKEAIRRQRVADGEEVEEFLDEREKRLWERQRELEADLANAGDLLGSTSTYNITASSSPPGSSHEPLGSGPSGAANLDSLLGENPRTKEEFEAFSQKVYNIIIKPHINKPLYAGFVEAHVRQLCEPLKDSEVRKAANGLTTLAATKLHGARDKTSGKKKPKAAVVVGGVKGPAKYGTAYYDEALDDFGNDADDFM